MRIKSYISFGMASCAVLAGANMAEAAALQGRVGINPPNPVDGVPSGVRFIGTGGTVPGTDLPATDFDFVPPFDGGTGAIVELNTNPFEGRDDFAPFLGQTGTILDVTALQLGSVAAGVATIPNFIEIPGAFSVTLTNVGIPDYAFDGNGTTVSIGVEGDFINLSDGSGDVSFGEGSFSVDFAGLSIAETQALFDEPGEIPSDFDPGTWSSNFVVAEGDVPPPEVVPEASSLLGLLALGVGGATMMARKKNKLEQS